ncbi:MAG: DUF4288 domain-containing protein [Bacteroidia bacterium]|nr:DUF4288 domain-containing protein [Bacteroidia bacterium]
MNWYLAKIVFRIICGDGKHNAQFDEQLRLINANDKQEAFSKAQAIGKTEAETFFNHKEQLVQWHFINVSELYHLNKMMDGAELYSCTTEKEDAAHFEYVVNKKAENILFTNTHQMLRLA